MATSARGKAREGVRGAPLARWTAAAVLSVAAACSSYRPRPLQTDMEWARLESVRLGDLVAPRGPAEALGDMPAFDYSDGLSPDEAAAVAVALNPELRAFRAGRGVAEGQLIEAGLLPNPELDGRWTNLSGAIAGELSVLFDLSEALATRGPRTERARARIEEVRWEVADREWQLANDVRAAWIALAYAGEALALLRSQGAVAGRTVDILRARREAGSATELDIVVAESERAEVTRQERRLAGNQRLALERLNALLGLPPAHETRIGGGGIGYTALDEAERGDAGQLRIRRPDLQAAEKAYLVAENELHVAYRRRWGNIGLGPSTDSAGGSVDWGVALSWVIPVFHLNQGEIDVRAAERHQRREAYVALLHRARAELQETWSERVAINDELAVLFSEVAPHLDRSIELAEAAFRGGELDLLQVLLLQSRALDRKRETLERLRDFQLAGVAHKRALGPPQPDTGS